MRLYVHLVVLALIIYTGMVHASVHVILSLLAQFIRLKTFVISLVFQVNFSIGMEIVRALVIAHYSKHLFKMNLIVLIHVQGQIISIGKDLV